MTITLFPFSKHERVEFPVLIFFDDHHEPFQYYAEDLEEFYKVCLRVIENRLGSYYQDPGEPPKTPEDVLELNVIEKLPEPYKKDALQKYKNHKRDIAWHEEGRNLHITAKKAVETKNGIEAYGCLKSHRMSGDEGFSIVNIEDLRV